jgi:hypothetical protein
MASSRSVSGSKGFSRCGRSNRGIHSHNTGSPQTMSAGFLFAATLPATIGAARIPLARGSQNRQLHSQSGVAGTHPDYRATLLANQVGDQPLRVGGYHAQFGYNAPNQPPRHLGLVRRPSWLLRFSCLLKFCSRLVGRLRGRRPADERPASQAAGQGLLLLAGSPGGHGGQRGEEFRERNASFRDFCRSTNVAYLQTRWALPRTRAYR